MRLPILPRPRSPSVLPDNVIPVLACHPPARMRKCSSARLRTVAIINPQANSGVASRTERNLGLAKSECATRTPLSVAAAMSRFGRLLPTMVISLRFGSRSMRVRGSAMRSRRVQRTSNGLSTSAASSSERCRSKTVISARSAPGTSRRGRAPRRHSRRVSLPGACGFPIAWLADVPSPMMVDGVEPTRGPQNDRCSR